MYYMSNAKAFIKTIIMFDYVLILIFCQYVYSEGSNSPPQQWKLTDNWPLYKDFGQISSVSVDSAGNVYVFHRGDRVWDYRTFSPDDIYRHRELGPISQETIVILDQTHGSCMQKVGDKMFYMPHGITVDHLNNIWVTDVALHQIFKFPPLNKNVANASLAKAEIILGEAFKPGDDDNHFCKPTDVAVDMYTNDFYVSDGYCNSRIIKYDKNGKALLHWGRGGSLGPYSLNVPHALSLAANEKKIYVADRENLRTVVYNSNTGTFSNSFMERKRIYSIAYSSVGGKHLFTLSNSTGLVPGFVTVYDVENGRVVERFSSPNYFSNPHTIAVSGDGRFCYVGELNPHVIWKFERQAIEQVADQKSHASDENKKVIDPPKIDEANKRNYPDAHKADEDFTGGTVLAIGLVSFIIIITFIIFVFHVYKRKARYAQYEMRRLILDDEEEVIMNTS